MKLLTPFLIGICFCLTNYLNAQQPEIQQGLIYVKVNTDSNKRSNPFDLKTIPGFKSMEPVRKTNPAQRQKPSILEGLYKIKVEPTTDIRSVCQNLNLESGIVYAEPVYKEQLLYVPNDPQLENGNQDYLEVIKAQDAWDITKGSSNIVIGISDSGLDLNNPDIAPKIFINENDPINDIDDDGNGYVDDYQGYDFAEADNDPSPEEGRKHGTMVGGLAAAATDNEFGIAGVGFNARLAALKVQNAENAFINSYESIIYAADIGYDVINLSWGSPNSYSQAAQDIITYAAVEKGLVIVAAAGNTPNDLKFYPASYEHVLSVASSNLQDVKAGFSTYSTSVDLMAPGQSIFSLALNNEYATDNGTSYSAPMVAGAAALVKSVFPQFNGLQVAEQLRVTADNVYEVGSNSNYSEQLGYGRLNVFRAVTEDSTKSIRLQQVEYNNAYQDGIYPGDTITVQMNAINYLLGTDGASLQFSSSSPLVEVLIDSMTLPPLNTLETASIDVALFKVSDTMPPETSFAIRVGIRDGAYEDFQYLNFQSASDRIDINNGTIELTVSGRGHLGYNQDSFFDGIGFRSNTTLQANRMGIVIAKSPEQVSDNLPVLPLSNDKSKDFISTEAVRYEFNQIADLKVTSKFKDDVAESPLGIEVEQSLITNEGENFLIQEYRLMNTSGENHEVSIGYYVDWDLAANIRNNKAAYDASNNVVIAVNENGTRYAGIKTYFDPNPAIQLLDIEAVNQNEPDIEDLTEDTKYDLSHSSLLDEAGNSGAGNNIAVLVAQDGLQLPPSLSKKATFLVAFGSSKEALLQNITKAENLYTSYLAEPELLGTYVGCAGAGIDIQPDSSVFRFYTDPLGDELITQGQLFNTGPITSDTTFYAARMLNNVEQEIQRIEVTLVDKVADFTMSTDTLFLDEQVNTVQFVDRSFEPASWQWDFGNGIMATVQHPTTYYDEVGSYNVSLTVISTYGCSETITQSLVVAERPAPPDLSDAEICQGEMMEIKAPNADSIALYLSMDAEKPFTSGASVAVGPIDHDTTFYLTNITGPFESLKTPYSVSVSKTDADFEYYPDTTRNDPHALLITNNDQALARWYIDGALVSSENSYSLPVTKANYQIALAVTSNIGCRDSVHRAVSFQQSPTPRVSFEQPCNESDLKLSPTNGSIFGFYADQNLENLLYKGKTLHLENIKDSVQVYIVGLDSILPSPVVLAEIEPDIPAFQINASQDTLFLDQNFTVKFSAEGEPLTQYRWFINSEFVEAAVAPRLLLDSIGEYEVVLRGTNSNECSNSDTLLYNVLSSRPQIILSSHPQQFSLYPNPATHEFYVNIDQPGKLIVSDLSGKKILQKEVNTSQLIDIKGLTPATYLVTFITEKSHHTEQLIIK